MASLEQQRWLRFGWNAARYALGPIGGLLIPWLVVRQSGLGTWGDVQTPLIWLQLIVHITAWGSKEFLLKQFAAHPHEQGKLLGNSIATRGVLLVVMTVVWLFDTRMMSASLAIAAVLLFLNSSLEPVIAWHKRFKQAALADLIGLVVQVAYIGTSVSVHGETIFVSICLNQAVRAFLLLALNWSVFSWEQPTHWDFRTHLHRALPFFLIGFSGLLASRIDLYTANALLERAEVGRYQIVASLFIQFQALAALAVAPMAKDLYRLKLESVARYTRRMRTWALIGLAPMCLVAWAVFTFLFKFELHWSIYPAACALVWPVYAFVPMMNQLYKHHRERSVMWANFAAAVVTCGLTLILLPRLGVAGGLLAAAAGQWLMLTWMKREEHRLHALPGM
ncbi:MAG: hypothetical protein ABI599_09645 [Flavobacteriales bacterium]